MYTTASDITARSTTPLITRSGAEVPAGYYAAQVTIHDTVFEYLIVGNSWDRNPDAYAVGAITRDGTDLWTATGPDGAQALASRTDRKTAFQALVTAHANALAAGTAPLHTGTPGIGERRMSFLIQPCGPDGGPINGGNSYANANAIGDARNSALRMLGSNADGTYLGRRVESVDITGRLVEFTGHAWAPVKFPDARTTHEVITRPGPHFCNTDCYDGHATPWDRAGDAAELCQDAGHHQRYPDSTPESTRAHVTAHLFA